MKKDGERYVTAFLFLSYNFGFVERTVLGFLIRIHGHLIHGYYYRWLSQ